MSTSARAYEPSPMDEVAPGAGLPGETEIYGGETVNDCGWPTTVSLDGCTGTLVHPEVVLFAGHCIALGGGAPNVVTFGEDFNQPARTVQTTQCGAHPNWQNPGNDLAWCRLAQPVTDIPIVPPLMGCEVDQLQVGSEVTIVGFGEADDNLGWGPKREVTTTVTDLYGGEAYIGGNGLDSCQGDSGGPVYIQLDDGSWRVFGITSGGGACGTGGIYEMMHVGMEWFEGQIGLDITPCTDADGTWNPGPDCAEAPYEPGTAGGAWNSGCSATDVTGLIGTCGEPYGGGGGEEDTGGGEEETTGGGEEETTGGGEEESGGGEEESTGGEEESGGESGGESGEDSGDDEVGGDGDTAADEGETAGDGGGADGDLGEEGCSCSSADAGGSGSTGLGLGLLGLGLVWRRRRS
ncbi:Peptidase S1 and S6, chymotrypsin/Hap [Plesiocystis pacifica SIR-1]|uniref:Peptidase S1 and S6, chymotrypsin/Hap n=1 Tax=Plesiocystis pacifica SIR-1 TaxID=391625 RepID=A6G3Y6_9BACT|nr:trypsin-like serine protease [Plesiocystis pacifica]EDM79523.1 Peptidase S1 and S6, chymotrypsin/Hap [Plesiocystis pacifica SIR-1]